MTHSSGSTRLGDRRLRGDDDGAEGRYRELVEHVPAVVYLARPGPAGVWLYVSPQIESLLGFSPEEWSADPDLWVSRIHPDDRRRVIAAEQDFARRTGEVAGERVAPSLRQEYRIFARDGRTLWIRDESFVVPARGDEPVLLRGVLVDITEQKRWEQALEDSERRTRGIIESSMDAIVAMDDRGCIAEANPAAESLFGWSRDELIGRPVAELVATKERGRHEAGVARRLTQPARSRAGVRVESTGVRRDGTEFPVEVTVVELEAASGARFTAFLRDLSARKQAEEAVRQSETRFRLIAENARDIVYRYRIQPTPGYEYVSPAVETLTGYRPEEFYADPVFWMKVTHPEDVERVTELFGSGRAFTETYRSRWITRDGRTMWAESRNAPVHDGQGTLTGFVGIIRDVTDQVTSRQTLELTLETLQRSYTDRRRLMARLVGAQELERKRIAGEVHDDSVQAMAAVGLRLDMLKRRIDDEEVAGTVDELRTTVDTAVSRLRRLMFDLRPPALDRDGLVPALRLFLEETERTWGLRFNLVSEVAGDVPEGSRLVLYRIAQEAVANVRRHAQASTVSVELSTDGGGIRLRIRDDGRGFPVPEHGESPPGHLGLSSMREQAEMAGGKLSLQSQPGRGTTVEAWIPERSTIPG